jgi:serine/threonine-protein kinase
MDFVDGRPLDQRIADGPLPTGEAVAIATIVSDALAVAHDRGIVHRDIKPGNILVDEHGVPHLVDFGIAALLDVPADALTATSEMVGTLRYAAPERLAGEPATARTDVWALGAVLYEMLTGQPAVTATDPAGALVASRAAPTDVTLLPADMAGIVGRAMATDPAERYPDAAALRDALAMAEAPVDPDAATRAIAVPVAVAAAETAGPAPAPSDRLSEPTAPRRSDRRAAWVALALGVALAAGALAFGAGSNGGSTPSEAPPAAVDAPATPAPTAVPTPQRAVAKGPAGNGKGKGKEGHKGKGR